MMTRLRNTLLASAVTLLLFVGSSHQQELNLNNNDGGNDFPESYNIGEDACILEDKQDFLIDVAKSNPDFSTLVAALESVPDLAPVFETKDNKLTILAPTNAAFDQFFSDFNSSAEQLLADQDLTRLLLSYHVIPSVVPWKDMEQALEPLFMSQVGVTTSVNGDDLALTRVQPEGSEDYVIRAAGYASAAFLEPKDSVWACNGVIQPINYVLVPRSATITTPTLRVTDPASSGAGEEGQEGEGEGK
jgi:uncharacterized surface protein with fasciclin (FAS1) repeats